MENGVQEGILEKSTSKMWEEEEVLQKRLRSSQRFIEGNSRAKSQELRAVSRRKEYSVDDAFIKHT